MTTVTNQSQRSLGGDIPGWVVAGLVIIFSAIGISYLVAHPDPPVPWTLEFVLGITPPVVLMYIGYQMTRSEFPLADEWYLLRACLLGGFSVGAVALAYVGHAILVGQPHPDLFVLVSVSIATGGVVGLVASVGWLMFGSELDDHLNTDPVDRSWLVSRSLSRTGADGHDQTRSNTPTHISPEGRALADLLADRERWYIIERVSRSEQPIAVPTLTRELADRSGSQVAHGQIRLRHVTLPALEREGLVVVHSRTDSVEAGPELEAVTSGVGELQRALASFDDTRDPSGTN